MPRYQITRSAGREVAGRRNTGVGTILNLPEDLAQGAVDEGALWPLDAIHRAPDASDGGEGEQGTPVDLSALTVAQLHDLAKDRSVEVSSGAKKADLIAALEGGGDGD